MVTLQLTCSHQLPLHKHFGSLISRSQTVMKNEILFVVAEVAMFTPQVDRAL